MIKRNRRSYKCFRYQSISIWERSIYILQPLSPVMLVIPVLLNIKCDLVPCFQKCYKCFHVRSIFIAQTNLSCRIQCGLLWDCWYTYVFECTIKTVDGHSHELIFVIHSHVGVIVTPDVSCVWCVCCFVWEVKGVLISTVNVTKQSLHHVWRFLVWDGHGSVTGFKQSWVVVI
jgi:hypothetical protein